MYNFVGIQFRVQSMQAWKTDVKTNMMIMIKNFFIFIVAIINIISVDTSLYVIRMLIKTQFSL